MSKDLFIAAHEELVNEYLDRHPNADWATAYDKTADAAYDRYCDKFADMADAAKQHAKNDACVLATIKIPHGYRSAKEFAEDCGFELVEDATEPTP